MSFDPRVKKIDGTKEITFEKRKQGRYYFIASMIMFGVTFVSYFVWNPSVNSGPLWTLPLESQITLPTTFLSIIIGILLFYKSPVLTFEKRIFLELYTSYKCLTRYNSLAGSSSQEYSDFEKAFESLKSVSLELKKVEKSKYSDIKTEINRLFVKMGELIQTRLLPSIKREKDLKENEENILQLADTFADINFNRVQSMIGNLEKLEKNEPIALESSFLESHPRVRSYYAHVYKLIVSLFVVFFVALLFSIIFQKPISDFAVYIFTAFFVLFGAWEFKSNK
jgi:hypothetical protein